MADPVREVDLTRERAAFEAWIRREYDADVTWEIGDDHPAFAPLPPYGERRDHDEVTAERDARSLWDEWSGWKGRAALARPAAPSDAEAMREACANVCFAAAAKASEIARRARGTDAFDAVDAERIAALSLYDEIRALPLPAPRAEAGDAQRHPAVGDLDDIEAAVIEADCDVAGETLAQGVRRMLAALRRGGEGSPHA